jgi:hypothetical protein
MASSQHPQRSAQRENIRPLVIPASVVIVSSGAIGVKNGVWPGKAAGKMGENKIRWTSARIALLMREPVFISHLMAFQDAALKKPVSAGLPNPAEINYSYKNAIGVPKRQI